MEKAISAAFRSKEELEHAVHALRKQGAIDIRVTQSSHSRSMHDAHVIQGQPELHEDAEAAEEFAHAFDVLVEPSRSRQAEDTIAQFGGRLNTFLE